MPKYESLVLYHPSLGDDGAKEATAKTRELIQQLGGTVESVDEWGLRDLAYEIDDQRRGFYSLFVYESEVDPMKELERQLGLNDRVLRFMTVHHEIKLPPAARRQKKSGKPKRERREGDDERDDEEDAGGREVEAEG